MTVTSRSAKDVELPSPPMIAREEDRSAKKTDTFSHQAKDGHWYKTYMDKVNANKKINEGMLREKGLGQLSKHWNTSRKSVGKKRPSPTAAETTRRRSSRRLANQPAENKGVDMFFGSLDDQIREKGTASKKPRVRKTGSGTTGRGRSALTPEQAKQLANLPEWLDEMHQFLLKVPHGNNYKTISQENARSVMRQVRLLAGGLGITYPRHWGDNVVFCEGVNISLGTDFEDLLKKAQAMEDEHGRDRGNGWLMRHPIVKLMNYQEYRAEM